ncbi:MAG: photosystem II manganese-stabilizing polypeptide [Pseudanabaena sp. ELA607]
MKFRLFTKVFLTLIIGLATFFAGNLFTPSALAGTNLPLTYEQIRGTGLANTCPDLQGSSRGRSVIPLAPGQSVEVYELCMQPTSFFVKEEPLNKRKAPDFVSSKLLTRATSSLDYIKATVTANEDGSLSFKEKEGLDYQPITVQMPGGERVAILFTIKGFRGTTQPGLKGLGSAADFVGQTEVPTYRGANFIDPKGRGLAIGYEAAEALPAKRDVYKESTKDDTTYTGRMSLQVDKLNADSGEIAGVFECEQFSDTDMGGLEPKEVLIRGVFYGRLNNA